MEEPVQQEVKQEWVDYPTAEKFTALSHTTLWRYVSRGEIRSARVGRSVRIHLPSLKAFMEDKASEATGERAASRFDGDPKPCS